MWHSSLAVSCWFLAEADHNRKPIELAWFTRATENHGCPGKLSAYSQNAPYQLTQTRNLLLNDGEFSPFAIVPFNDGTMPNENPVSSLWIAYKILSLFLNVLFRVAGRQVQQEAHVSWKAYWRYPCCFLADTFISKRKSAAYVGCFDSNCPISIAFPVI